MKLEYLMTYRAELKPPVEVGAGPFGTRRIFDVTGGTAEGPRLRGKLLASGGDWLLVDADGTTTYWSHDGTSVAGSEPTTAIQLFVTDGIYSVMLGSPDISNMAPIPPALIARGRLFLRAWWAPGFSRSFEQLPDQQ